MDIILEKDILHNLGKSVEIEWLEKNKFDIYSSSTCIGMNTRREHGLFVVPDTSAKKKVVLLSKLEESVFIENKLHEISTNSYKSGIFPSGYNYLSSFKMNPFPCSTFTIEDRKIEKKVFLSSQYPMMVVRYELKNQGIPINLIIKPFLADRFNTELTQEVQGLNTDSYLGHNFVRWALKQNMPEIYVYYSAGEFAASNLWYKNFTYTKDTGKYKDAAMEHLFNPGFFQAKLHPYQALDLYISTCELDLSELNFESIYRREVADRCDKKEYFFNDDDNLFRISRSLKQALKKIGDKSVISVSVMENVFTTRDIIFSMPAFFLINEDYEGFKQHYLDISKQLSEGLLPVHSPLIRDKNHYSAADLSLWYINLGYLYFEQTADLDFFENGVYESFKDIIEFYLKGTLNNIYVDKDSLVFSGNKTSSTSWIPLTIENNEVLRFGKLLEVNALWYNALKIIEKLSEKLGKKRKITKYGKLAEDVKESFTRLFVLNNEGLADFVTSDKTNVDFRVNQIVPLSLPFSILDNSLALNVLRDVDKNLLTPYGLRSAQVNENPKNNGGNLNRKTMAYYDGAVWPWALDLYTSASLNYTQDKKETARKLEKHFSPLLNLVNNGMLNYLPEAISFNGSPSFTGTVDFTPSLSGILWSYYKIYNELRK